jgi:WD40 repeat protein
VKTGVAFPVLKGEPKKGYLDASFSPDGDWIVTTSQDMMLRICTDRTGALVRTLEGHTGVAFSASFSPDGKRIVSTGSAFDMTARVWDVATGKELVKFQGHGQPGEEFPVWHAAFSPDGKRVVSTGNGKTIIWDAETGAEVVRLKGVNLGDYAAFSPDGKRLITTSGSGVTICDAMTGQELLTIKSSGVNRLEFSPDGSQIPVVTPEGVRLYDTRPIARGREEPKK